MGFLRLLLGSQEYADNYENGADWAETLEDVGAEVSPMQAERMAHDLSDNPHAFHDGFRDMWNSGPNVEKEPGWWDRLCGRG